MKQMKMNAGSVIYFEDSTDQNVYIIKVGKVELTKKSGNYLVNNVLKKNRLMIAGDCFGFEDIFYGTKRGERAIAKTEVILLYFGIDEFSQMLKNNAKIGEKLLNSLARRVRNLNDRIKISCSDETKMNTSIGSIKDLYSFYAKKGEFRKAVQVLERIIKDKKYQDFAVKEKDRIKLMMGPTITEEKIDELISMYESDETDVLVDVLDGVLEINYNTEIKEKILFEEMNLNENKSGKFFIEKAENYLTNCSESKHSKEVMIKLSKIYCEDGMLVKGVELANQVLEKELTTDEYKIVEKILDEFNKEIIKLSKK